MRVSLKWALGLVLLAGTPVQAADALNAAASQVAAGDYPAALTTLDRLDGAAADAAAPLFLRAAALAGSGRLEEAALLFERLIAIHPELPEAYNNLAALRARQGQLAEAKALLERALRTDERYATVYENLSTIYVEMARSSYAKALRLEAGAQAPRLTLLTSLATVPTTTIQQVAVAPVANPAPAPTKPSPAAPPGIVEPAPVVPAAVAEPESVPVAAVEPASVAMAEPESVPVAAVEPASVTVAEPEPASVAEPVPVVEAPPVETVPEAVRLAVVTALSGWARAWSQQDVDTYLAYYDADFAPEGMERPVWEAERRSRISRPAWIKVELEAIKMEAPVPDAVVVTLRQRYAAPGYKDTTHKQLDLALREGNWMITSEINLKVQR